MEGKLFCVDHYSRAGVIRGYNYNPLHSADVYCWSANSFAMKLLYYISRCHCFSLYGMECVCVDGIHKFVLKPLLLS